MTTLISRLFPDQKAAQRAVNSLTFKGMPRRACTIIAAGDGAKAAMARAKVHPSAVDAYTKGIAKGHAVLVVQATYKPLGAARLARETMDRLETVSVGKVTEEHQLAWQPDHAPSILKDHPLFATLPVDVPHGPVTANFGMRMTKPHGNKRPLTTRRSSSMFWPMKLVSKKKRSSSVISGGRHMSRMFWPMPLLSSKPRRKSVIPGGGVPFSRLFGMRTVS